MPNYDYFIIVTALLCKADTPLKKCQVQTAVNNRYGLSLTAKMIFHLLDTLDYEFIRFASVRSGSENAPRYKLTLDHVRKKQLLLPGNLHRAAVQVYQHGTASKELSQHLEKLFRKYPALLDNPPKKYIDSRVNQIPLFLRVLEILACQKKPIPFPRLAECFDEKKPKVIRAVAEEEIPALYPMTITGKKIHSLQLGTTAEIFEFLTPEDVLDLYESVFKVTDIF